MKLDNQKESKNWTVDDRFANALRTAALLHQYGPASESPGTGRPYEAPYPATQAVTAPPREWETAQGDPQNIYPVSDPHAELIAHMFQKLLAQKGLR